MTACLSDRVLWALSEGDGTATEREHLEQCSLCAHRTRHLAEDLAVIGQVLRGPSPAPAVVGRHRRAVPLTWGVATALAVLLLVIVLSGGQKGGPSSTVADPDGVTDLTALATSVFGEDGQSSTPATDLDVIATAFEAAGPCEWQPGGCDDDSESLF